VLGLEVGEVGVELGEVGMELGEVGVETPGEVQLTGLAGSGTPLVGTATPPVVLVLLGGGHTGAGVLAGVAAAAGTGLVAGATCAGAEKTCVMDGCARPLPFRADEWAAPAVAERCDAEGREEE